MKNRRKHFLIDKALQFHYLFYIVATLGVVSAVGMTGSYFGIWSSAVKVFSAESLRESMLTAAQIHEYEQAKRPPKEAILPSVRSYQEIPLLSERQREMIREIMDETSQRLLGLGVLLLVFIGWGSIFLTHKIAGPIFNLEQHLHEIENGNLAARMRLRKFDEMPHLEKQFNEMAGALDAAMTKMKRLAKELPREVASEELKRELTKFKTTSD
ncbi:MAG: hypothetical protein HY585_04600 [Candidatus Omnitrophica bacterium]|nr:hypothetical protein [Candidatus Omnitrophota bacterium]